VYVIRIGYLSIADRTQAPTATLLGLLAEWLRQIALHVLVSILSGHTGRSSRIPTRAFDPCLVICRRSMQTSAPWFATSMATSAGTVELDGDDCLNRYR
jgi:hypothetical protein